MRVVLSILLLLPGLILFSQADALLKDFTVLQQNNYIVLNWTIHGGETCDGIFIQRSDDNINFTEIGDIPGVCGSPDEPLGYTFTDSIPVNNKVNYYRLSMGNAGLTSVKEIFYLNLYNTGHVFFSNPVKDISTIRFRNENSLHYQFMVYNVSGLKVMQLQTNEDVVIINRNDFKSGVYIFHLINKSSGHIIKGRFNVI